LLLASLWIRRVAALKLKAFALRYLIFSLCSLYGLDRRYGFI